MVIPWLREYALVLPGMSETTTQSTFPCMTYNYVIVEPLCQICIIVK